MDQVKTTPQQIQLKSKPDCKLAIGRYPPFTYNAIGGGGYASIKNTNQPQDFEINFNAEQLMIPPLNYRTTKILGLPLPPGLQIAISPQRLEGTIQKSTGTILLDFDAIFSFTIGNWVKAPELIVKTKLTSGVAKGKYHIAKGRKKRNDGSCILGGIAEVPITRNCYMDNFLGLPNEALAVLKCDFISENGYI